MSAARTLALAVLILVVVYFLFSSGPLLAAYLTDLLTFVEGLGVWAPLAFVAAYAIATVAFVPGSLLTLSGGLLFGLGWGTLLVFLGAGLGSALAFLISRFLVRGAIEKRLAGNAKFAAIDKAVGEEGLKIVFLLRLVPFFPFIWLNYGLGLTKVTFRDYVLASVGMLPGTFLYVYYGVLIGNLAALRGGPSAAQRGPEQWVFLGIGLVAALAVTRLITRTARKALRQATENAEASHG